MKAFLDHFGAILGALTVALLTMSASHEYGYFLVVGQHFQTLLTTTDYIATAYELSPNLGDGRDQAAAA